MIRPPFLKKGDTVGICCTARKVSLEEIQQGIDMLKSWDLNVVLGDTIGKIDNQYGGTDAERQADFQRMLNDKNINSIIAARGGYGTVRMMDTLDFRAFMDAPKWLVGFSDMTYLHTQLNCNIGVETLHAMMAFSFPTATNEAIQSLKDALFGNTLEYDFSTHELNRNGIMRGEVVGGNLSILYANLGTKTILDTNKKILFIEDLDEYLYHIDRMMMAMKRAGKLKGLSGLVVGGLSDMKDNTVPFGKTAEEIIFEHVAEYDYPVCFNFPAGHIADNRAIFMGKQATVEVNAANSVFKQ
ncbi:MAG TPA: LD-carboxypeptidase [Chitinophagales bacterium]|nr:LD-carboxypeptidase [Chitinophagales bacterium]